MADYKAAFLRYLDEQGIKYIDKDPHRVQVVYAGDHIKTVEVNVIFDADGKGLVTLCTWCLGKTPEDKFAAALLACNELNHHFRWVKFYVDDEQDITADTDAVVDLETVGEECLQLVRRMVSICDEAYPTIMKAIWN